MSLGIAITIRVAGKFSQGKHVKAIFISRLATILLFSLSTIVCVILFLLRAPLGRLFTTSNTVINLMTANIAISLLFMLLDSVRIALGGIFAAMGKHALLAVLTFAEFFVIAVPLMLLVSYVLLLSIFYLVVLYGSKRMIYWCFVSRGLPFVLPYPCLSFWPPLCSVV